MPRKLNLNVEEMLHMRESGNSNRDIAKMLGVSIATVTNRIGPEGRYKYGGCARYQLPPHKQEEPEEQFDATLVVQNKSIELTGVCGVYVVDYKKKNVLVSIPKSETEEEVFNVEFERMETFIKELQSIQRGISGKNAKGGIGNEMW